MPRLEPRAGSGPEPESEACRRLGDALVDGRFAEDPSAFTAHADACLRCRARVAGYRRLRSLIDASRPAEPTSASRAPDPARAWSTASDRYRRHRRRRRIAAWGVAALVPAVALVVGFRPALVRPPVVHDDPAAYARSLSDRALRSDGTRVDLRAEAPEFERELRDALDHPAAAVRRTAFWILALAGRRVEPDQVERLLRDAAPTLEGPVELAGTADPRRYVAEAMERGRTATLRSVLGMLPAVVAERGGPIPVELVAPYVTDADAEVRRLALMALTFAAPSYTPDAAVWDAARRDPSEEVRIAAALLLAKRDQGEALAAHFDAPEGSPADPNVEAYVATLLGAGPRAQALALRRVASAPPNLALAHALALARRGTSFAHADLAARALATGDGTIAWRLSTCAAAGDWRELREPLHQAWRVATGLERQNLAATLARWDVRVGTPDRVELALEILADGRTRAAEDVLATLEASADADVRRRAAELRRAWDRHP